MIDYYTVLGMVLACLIAIVGVYVTVKNNAEREKKPIDDLNINIAKLTVAIESMKESDQIRDRRINKHGEEIDNLNKVVNLHELRLNKIDNCNLLKNKGGN
mgnify:FL=1